MRNAFKAAVAATLMVSMPVSGAIAARPSASVPSGSNINYAKGPRAPWANPFFFIPIGIAIAIIAVSLGHKDKNEPPPVSRG